jgi:dephospho-CoA kinase
VVQRWRIGLTGGIGSGKSTVARVWQAMGAAVLDADAIAKQVTAPQGRAMAALLAAFGPDCVASDGAMDRAWMRARVLEQPGERQRLEQILHPLIGEEIRHAAARCTAPVLVFDVPLLVESTRWRVQLDHVVVIDCTRGTQIERVVRRSGWSPQEVERIIDQQAARAERLRAADTVLFNQDIAISTLEQRVRQLGLCFGLSSPD